MGVTLLICLGISFSAASSTTSKIEDMAKKVIELRQEVELLNEEYKSEREIVVNQLKALSVQKAELESNIRSEKNRKKQLDNKIKSLKNELGENLVTSSTLIPTIQLGIEKLRQWIQSSIPLKTHERLAVLDQLERKLKSKEISPIKAANQLWTSFEDERRLAKETNLYKETIQVDGKMKLATIAKVGALFVYFKTDDGQLGMARKYQNEWQYVPFSNNNDESDQTLVFFDSLKKQMRQGFFTLPTAI